MANSPSMPNSETVRRALESARNCDDGQLDPRMSLILETAISELWRKIQLHPDTYVLSGDEFALFNYFRERFGDSPVARQAVERFWNNFRGAPSDIEGYLQCGRRQ